MFINNISLNGNLAADPTLGRVNGDPVLNFRIGNNNPFRKDKDGQPLTSWVNVSVFGKQATNLSERLKKGSHVIVVGELAVKDTEYNGQPRTFVEIRANSVQMVPSGGGSAQFGNSNGSSNYSDSSATEDDLVVPF